MEKELKKENTDKIKDFSRVKRLREKLISKGAQNLEDVELLTILLSINRGGRSGIQTSQQILRKFFQKELPEQSYEDLIKTKGIGPARACVILAAQELEKRALKIKTSKIKTSKIKTSKAREERFFETPLAGLFEMGLFQSILSLFKEKEESKKRERKRRFRINGRKLIRIGIVILGIMSTASFMQFILEEAIQMHSFGLYPILSNKNIETAEKVRVIDEHKEFCKKASSLMNLASVLNPITGIFYERFIVASFKKVENDYRSIYGVVMSDLDEVELNCIDAKVGQKCIMKGRIRKIKTGGSYTVFTLLGKDKIAYSPHPIGGMKEIYHLSRAPAEGDLIEVVGRKIIYKGTPEVKLGYLTITVYSEI